METWQKFPSSPPCKVKRRPSREKKFDWWYISQVERGFILCPNVLLHYIIYMLLLWHQSSLTTQAFLILHTALIRTGSSQHFCPFLTKVLVAISIRYHQNMTATELAAEEEDWIPESRVLVLAAGSWAGPLPDCRGPHLSGCAAGYQQLLWSSTSGIGLQLPFPFNQKIQGNFSLVLSVCKPVIALLCRSLNASRCS